MADPAKLAASAGAASSRPLSSGASEPLPLAGKRILVTRPEDRGTELCAALRKAGAEPVHIPLIAIHPPLQFALLDEAAARLQPGDWIFLTSPSAVPAVTMRLRARLQELLEAGGVSIAAVGPGTSAKAQSLGLRVNFVSSKHNGVAIAEELGERLRGRRVLLPRSDKASADLPVAIRKYGGEPLEVVAYRTVSADLDDFWQRIKEAEVDAITLYSPSQAQVMRRMGTLVGLAELQRRVPILAIGEVTAAACRKHGMQTPLVAADATVAAVVEALTRYFTNHKSAGADER